MCGATYGCLTIRRLPRHALVAPRWASPIDPLGWRGFFVFVARVNSYERRTEYVCKRIASGWRCQHPCTQRVLGFVSHWETAHWSRSNNK